MNATEDRLDRAAMDLIHRIREASDWRHPARKLIDGLVLNGATGADVAKLQELLDKVTR